MASAGPHLQDSIANLCASVECLHTSSCIRLANSLSETTIPNTKLDESWDFVLSDLYFYPGEKIRNGLDLMREILLINPQQRSVIHTSERKLTAPCIVLQKPYPISALLKLLRIPLSPMKVDE